ncbi:MAG: hypothetical protein SOX71_04410 [Candidatus Faecousia sp.]|nr:hypothetical protein [Candidatus Faecousia sp.]
MASGSDGSIIIDTELDTTGFLAGSKKLERAAGGVKRMLEAIGTNIQKGLSAAMPSLARELEQVTRGRQSLTNAGAQEAGATQQQMAAAVDSASTFAKEMRTLERSTTSLAGHISGLGEKVRTGFSTDRQLSKFQAQVDTTREKVAQLMQQLAQMGGQSVQTADYAQVSAAQQKAEQALLTLYNRREMQQDTGVSESSQAWQRLTVQIQNAEAEVQRYEAAMAAMQANGTAFVQGSSTAEYQQTAAALQDMMARLAEYQAMAGNFDTISAPAQASRAALASVDAELQQKPRDAGAASSALARFGGVLRSMGSAALTATKNLAQTSFKAFSSGIGGAVSSLKSFVTQSHKARAGTNGLLRGLTSLKTMLVSRMKRMFISAIINGIQDGIKALAQFSTEFNTSMSNIKNASKGLSANLSVSLGGLIRAIEPVVTRIINAISRAISYLNALFAMLGGKSTVTVAKKQMDSYADSAAGAGGAVKELKRQVYGFDELNKRSKDSDGGGGGGSNAGDLFEEVPIDSLLPDTIKGLFDRIKAAYEANDWTEIGRVIADGLNMGMEAVDNWITGTLQPKAVTWAQRTGQLINGIVEGADFALMGKILADGINTAIYFLATAIETIDWRTLGSQLATGLYSLISNIDLGRLIEGINALAIGFFNFFSGAIQAINWQQLGADIYNALKTMFTTLDYGGVISAWAEAFGSFIGGLAGLLWGFIETAISDLGDWMKEAFYENGEFTWEGFCNGIVDAVKGIGDWIVEHIFDPFIDGFKAAFDIHSPSTVMQEQGGYIVEGLLLGIKNSWTNITSFFSSVLGGLKSLLSSAWSSIKSGTSSAWSSIKTTVTSAFDGAKTSVTTAAATLKTNLGNAWNTLKTNTAQAWTNIKSSVSTAVSNLRTDTTTKVNGIRTTVQTAWTSLSSATSSAWSGIQSSVMGKWNALKSSMQSTSWYSVGSNICSGIASGINAGWSWLTSRVSSLASSLLSAAKRALGIRSPSRVFRDEVGENIGLGIAEGVTDTKANVLKAVSSVAQSATDGIEGSKIKLGVDSSISGLGVVADKLADIAASFHSIISMLTSLGGLSIPQIAAGSVVPVKTRVSGPDGYADFPGVTGSDFEEYMDENNRLLRGIMEALSRKTPGIDLDTLTRAITGAQGGLRRSYGV